MPLMIAHTFTQVSGPQRGRTGLRTKPELPGWLARCCPTAGLRRVQSVHVRRFARCTILHSSKNVWFALWVWFAGLPPNFAFFWEIPTCPFQDTHVDWECRRWRVSARTSDSHDCCVGLSCLLSTLLLESGVQRRPKPGWEDPVGKKSVFWRLYHDGIVNTRLMRSDASVSDPS